MPLHQLVLFGGLRVLDTSARELTIASRKGRALLAHVALAGTAGVSRERLAGVFWGDADESRARQSLRQSLSGLRREVGPLLIDRGQRLLFEAGLCDVDALAFESLAAQTDTKSLERAVTLFRGPLLDGVAADCGEEFDDWLHQERHRFETMNRRAYERLLRLYAGLHDHASVARTAEQAVKFDPGEESFWRAWMQAVHDGGQPHRVPQIFERCRGMLRRRLDADPGAVTIALLATLRAAPPPSEEIGQSALPSVAPAQPRVPGARAVTVSVATRALVLPAVAVMPFEVHGPADPTFAATLAAEFIGALSRIAGFAVLEGRLLFGDADPGSPAGRTIAGERRVAFLVSGRLERGRTDLFRWTIRLTDSDDGRHLWSRRVDLDDRAPERRDELVAGMVAHIEPQILMAGLRSSGESDDDDPWHGVRQAFAALFARGWSEDAVATAVQRYRDAIRADPAFALAYAHKALVLALAAKMGLVEIDASIAEARAAAERAIQLAPIDSEVLGVAGCAIADLGDPHRGETLLERAVEQNPDNPQAWAALGACRLSLARISDGLQSLARGVKLGSSDYRRTVWLTLMSRGLLYQRRGGEAVEAARAAVKSDMFFYPAWLALAAAHFQAGQLPHASRALAEARRIRPQLTPAESRPWISPRVAARMSEIWPATVD